MHPLTTILVFGIYSCLAGIILLFIPDIILPWMDIPVDGNSAWIRLTGFVLCCSSYYYIRSALSGNTDFAKYTVHTRFVAPVVAGVIVLTGEASWQLLPFGIVDALGGVWTWIALRKSQLE